MTTQNIIIGALVAVVVGVGGWYGVSNFLDSRGDTESTSALENEPAVHTADEQSHTQGVDMLSTLMEQGDVVCEVSYTQDDADTSSIGTFYHSQGRFRVEGDTTVAGQTFHTNALRTDNLMYVWTQTPFGMTALTFSLEDDELTGNSEDGGFNENQIVTYDCSPWRVREAMFVPPSDIEFTNLDEFTQNPLGNLPEDFELPEGFDASLLHVE